MSDKYFFDNLESVYKELDEKSSGTTKMIVPNPQLEKTTTNTYWRNVKKILMTINRPPEHFIDFINKELNTGEWISNSKSDGIVLIGKFTVNQITHVLQTYIKKYVICNICNSSNTTLEKNKDLRSYVVECKKCNSKYTV